MRLATLPYTGSLLLLFFFTSLFIGCSAQETRKVLLLPAPEKNEVAELSQRVKDQAAEIERLTAKLEAVTSDLEPLPEPIAPKLPTLKLKPDTAPEALQVKTEEETDVEGDSEAQAQTVADSRFETMQLYYRALAQIKNKDFGGALASLREFLKLTPDHVYADRVQYLISDVHYASREFGLAVVTANVLSSRYPHSFRVPDALFKRALALEAMGHREEARETLQELLKRFPRAADYEVASRRLAELTVEMKKEKSSSLSNP